MNDSTQQASRQPLFSLAVLLLVLLTAIVVFAAFIRIAAPDWPPTLSISMATFVFLVGFSTGQLIRWRFRMSLRATFLLFTVLIVICGAIASRSFQARSQRRAVSSIVQSGGHVSYTLSKDSIGQGWFRSSSGLPLPNWLIDVFGMDFFANVWGIYFGDNVSKKDDLSGVDFLDVDDVRFYQSRLSDAALTRIGSLDHLKTLGLRRVDLKDEDLSFLSELKKLEALFIDGNPKITDEAFAYLADLESLEHLWLDSTSVSLAEAIDGRAFRRLKSLNLGGTLVTDAQIKNLKLLTNLESLQFSRNQLTDDGIQELGELKKLRHLTLYNTPVTSEGVARLKEKLPNCEIYID